MSEFLVRQVDGNGEVLIGGGMYMGTDAAYHQSEDTDPFQITERHGENLAAGVELVDETLVKAGTYVVSNEAVGQGRKFLNLYVLAKSSDTANHLHATAGHCRLSVIRFTPIDAPHHGWMVYSPPAATSAMTTTLNSNQQTIYELNLDATGNTVDLAVNDVLMILGEFEAEYTDTSKATFVHSKIVLVDSANPPLSKDITQSTVFSMNVGVRGKANPAKAGAYRITSADAPSIGAHWKYLRLVAWTSDASYAPDDSEVEITQSEDQLTPPQTDGQGGKLSLARFRYAGETKQGTTSAQRWDQPEYNGPTNPWAPMEQICKVGSSSTKNNIPNGTLFTQTFANLSTIETLVAVSELSATDQDGIVKILGCRLALVDSSNTLIADISKPNETEMDGNMHHLHMTKVGIKNAPSGISTQTVTVRSVLWSDDGFDANCADGSGSVGTCSCCTCPPLVVPPATAACNSTMPTSNVSCDAVIPGNGRLAVLRLTTRTACFADCFPPGSPDGTVNIDDLVQLITHWGANADGTWGDVTDNSGTVDIDDLVALITHWGPNCDGTTPVPQSVSDCLQFSNGNAEKLQACLQSLCTRGITEGCQ